MWAQRWGCGGMTVGLAAPVLWGSLVSFSDVLFGTNRGELGNESCDQVSGNAGRRG